MTNRTPLTDRRGRCYESKPHPGRVVRVMYRPYDHVYNRTSLNTWRIEVIANSTKPSTIGRCTTVTEHTIQTRYRELRKENGHDD